MFVLVSHHQSKAVKSQASYELAWRGVPGSECIYTRIQRKANPCSDEEGPDPIQLRTSGGLVGVHRSVDRKYLKLYGK